MTGAPRRQTRFSAASAIARNTHRAEGRGVRRRAAAGLIFEGLSAGFIWGVVACSDRSQEHAATLGVRPGMEAGVGDGAAPGGGQEDHSDSAGFARDGGETVGARASTGLNAPASSAIGSTALDGLSSSSVSFDVSTGDTEVSMLPTGSPTESHTEAAFSGTTGPEDAGVNSAGGGTATELDASQEQTTLEDASFGDWETFEAGASSEKPRDGGVTCRNSLSPSSVPPPLLSETGLYRNILTKEVSAAVLEFQPKYVLWSDAADKQRWMYVPECESIDSSDMDDWEFPVGTRAFKEFSMAGQRLETRMIHRYGPGPDDFLFAHYLWNAESTEATLITETTPASDLVSPKGFDYTIPASNLCTRCHGESGGPEGGLPSRYLGFSAIQLSHDGAGVTMASLAEGSWLTRSKAEGYPIEGSALQQAALGYLHANCGMCHNESADGVWFPREPMDMLLRVNDDTPYGAGAYRTLVDVEVLGYSGRCSHRVYAGDPGVLEPPEGEVLSCILERMAIRDTGSRQMPPIAAHRVDQVGLDLIRDWVKTFQ